MGNSISKPLSCCVWGPIVLASMAWAAPANADTWTHGRDRPLLHELVSIDKTGESPWYWGFEDVAKNGDVFPPAEQAIDVRTVYVTTDKDRLWVRAYVSHDRAAGDQFRFFLFVDNDRNTSTGGGANAIAVHTAFNSDPTEGGYEHVIEVSVEEKKVKIWNWNSATPVFEEASVPRNDAVFEQERGKDSIRVNSHEHGYVQASVDLDLLGLTEACNARLFARSANDDATLGAGDLSTPRAVSCVSSDTNTDGVPDIVPPKSGCTRDAECPGAGVCIGRKCVIPAECIEDRHCLAGWVCTNDGRCVPEPSGACTTHGQCADLVCVNGQCAACTPGSNECGVGRQCAPNGYCADDTGIAPGDGGPDDIGGIELESDENIEGGACNCSTPGGTNKSPHWFACTLLALALCTGLCVRRRRRG